MTWRELLGILQNMEKVSHTCIDERVMYDHDGTLVFVDVYESLSSGSIHLAGAIVSEEEADGTEA